MCYKKLTTRTFRLLLTAFVLHTVFYPYVLLYADSLRFTDITAELGVEFCHVNGESGQKYFIEPIGSGVVLFDFDNDGDLDLYLVNYVQFDPATNPECTRRGKVQTLQDIEMNRVLVISEE